MPFAALLIEPITIITQSADDLIDEYGNDLPAEQLVATSGYLQQMQRSEREGFVPVEQWLLILEAGTVIQAGDQVIARDDTYTVAGNPWHVVNPRKNVEAHVEATLVRTAGGLEAS